MNGRVAVLLGAALAYVVAVVVWLGTDDRMKQESLPAYSVADTSDEGLSLAFAYLRESGRDVTALTRPLAQADLSPDAVLMRIGPSPDLSELMRALREENVEPVDEKSRKNDAESRRDGEKGEEKDGRAEKRRSARDSWNELEEELKRALRRRQGEKSSRDERGEAAPDASEEGGEPDSPDDEPPGDSSRVENAASERGASSPAATFLSASERAWVAGGGRLVLAIDGAWRGMTVVELEKPEPVRKTHPSWKGVTTLRPTPTRAFQGDMPPGHALFASGSEAVVWRTPFGRGEVVILACPDVLRNDRLAMADHLALLETLAGDERRRVAFDELSHGAAWESGLLDLLVQWGLGPCLVLMALAAGAAAWRARVRVGPPGDHVREARSEAVDLVDSVARLYSRVLRRTDAVDAHHRHLVREVARVTGLRDDGLDAKVRELTMGRFGAHPLERGESRLSTGDMRAELGILNHAFERCDRAHRP